MVCAMRPKRVVGETIGRASWKAGMRPVSCAAASKSRLPAPSCQTGSGSAPESRFFFLRRKNIAYTEGRAHLVEIADADKDIPLFPQDGLEGAADGVRMRLTRGYDPVSRPVYLIPLANLD